LRSSPNGLIAKVGKTGEEGDDEDVDDSVVVDVLKAVEDGC
jgi:hypothetical protein